jgi:hypothetical protein
VGVQADRWHRAQRLRNVLRDGVRRCSLAATACGCKETESDEEAADTAVNTTEKRYKRWAATPNFVRSEHSGRLVQLGWEFPGVV